MQPASFSFMLFFIWFWGLSPFVFAFFSFNPEKSLCFLKYNAIIYRRYGFCAEGEKKWTSQKRINGPFLPLCMR